jgi:hypothetical protein
MQWRATFKKDQERFRLARLSPRKSQIAYLQQNSYRRLPALMFRRMAWSLQKQASLALGGLTL